MICQNCNKEIAEESVSCPVCGAQVNKDAQQGEDQYEKAVQEWIRFFRCQSEEDAETLKQQTKNPGIREAIKVLMNINRRPKR